MVGCCVPPTLTMPTTDGITYTADPAGPYAMVPDGDGDGDVGRAGLRGRTTLPAGWTRDVDRRRRRTGCSSAMGRAPRWSPVAPEVIQATCANGVVTVPTVTAASGPTGVSLSRSIRRVR